LHVRDPKNDGGGGGGSDDDGGRRRASLLFRGAIFAISRFRDFAIFAIFACIH